jgi:hypothetical protein
LKQGPCFKCQDRAPGCHSTCEKYLKYKADREVEVLRERRGRNLPYYEYKMDHIKKG